jgi:two-component system sensor histidine kinase BaeS
MRTRFGDTLAARIAIGFVVMGFSVIALFAVVSLVLVERDLNAATGSQQRAAISAITATLRRAYTEDHNWTTADLGPTQALARAYGIDLAMRRRSSGLLLITARGAGGPATSFDVTFDGKTVARVSLPESSGLNPAEDGLRHTIATSIALTAGAAVALAVLGAALLGRRLARPLEQLAAAARRLGRGAKATRVGSLRGPREVHDLGAAFDAMADDLELQDQLRRSLAANVAHELRTPLSILQAETSALADGVTTWSPKLASSFDEEVGRLTRLVQDLGSLSSADAATLTIHRVPVRLDHVAVETSARLRHHFDARQVSLRVSVEPATILGDADRIEQIIGNLLLNGARYTPSGGWVETSVACVDGRAVLAVRDNGPGIPAEEREQVFERFVRGSTATGVPGSGVGLAVVRELVRAHGGTVEIDDSVELGCRFVVSFEAVSASTSASISTRTTRGRDARRTADLSTEEQTSRRI